MNNLQTPLSAEQKAQLQEMGLKPYQPHTYPRFADPDDGLYHLTSGVVLALSLAGRWYAPKLGVTRVPFTVSALMVPIFYYMSIHLKEKRFSYTSSPRRTFEENLEFYPVTRRAWNRAVAIRNAEIAGGAGSNKAE